MKTIFTLTLLVLTAWQTSQAQSCGSAQGDGTTYGTNNVWIGYVYQGKNFDTYYGYVNEGASASPNFDESFGGDNVSYATNGCSITTDNFSVRYKLTQSFSGNYSITVGGDDGYRLSLDGGLTWAIDKWQDQGYATTTYTVALNGATNLVLEYYENAGGNRISFNMTPICTGTGDPSIYGTDNVWQGYLYQGMNFDQYKGIATEGTSSNPNFDENFGNPGGSNTATYNTNSCSITTYQFSARYRLKQTFPVGNYTLTVKGDDGYRLSLDGGSTWVIDNWNDHSYATTTYSAPLGGTYNMVLEYYQDGGNDQITYSQSMTPVILPVTLTNWSAIALSANQAQLNWSTTNAVNFDHFILQRSTDGVTFQDVQKIQAAAGNSNSQSYSYTDQYDYNGSVYYRLEMVDLDGSARYSTIVSLSFHTSQTIRTYPTIVENGNLFVESVAAIHQARLELYDMNGQKLQENDWSSLQGRQPVNINSKGHLPAGAYIVRLSDSQSVLAKQIVIIK